MTELTDKLLKGVVALAAETAIDKYKSEKEKEIKESKEKKLHNTKLLLKKYRGFVAHCDKATYDALQVKEDLDLADIIELMTDGEGTRSLKVKSIQESIAKTRIVLHHIDSMLEYYRNYCKNSPKQEVSRRYEIIYHTYLSKDEIKGEDLAELLAVDKSTLYRNLNSAIQDLSALFFGCTAY